MSIDTSSSGNSELTSMLYSGSKGKTFSNLSDELNFDEVITFNHTYLKFRFFEGMGKKVDEFPFLMNHEFLLAGI